MSLRFPRYGHDLQSVDVERIVYEEAAALEKAADEALAEAIINGTYSSGLPKFQWKK